MDAPLTNSQRSERRDRAQGQIVARLEALLRQVQQPGFWGQLSLEVSIEDGQVQRFLEQVRRSHKC